MCETVAGRRIASMDTRQPGVPSPTSVDEPAPPAADREAWHTLTVAEVAARLRTDAGRGLAEAEAARRLQQYGPNALAETPGRSPLAIFAAQFQSLIVLLLVAATAVAFALGETIEAVAILVVIVLNAVIGFLTEWRAEQALTALQKQAVAMAQVVRDGRGARDPRGRAGARRRRRPRRRGAGARRRPGRRGRAAAGRGGGADGRVARRRQGHRPVADPVAPLGDRPNMAFMGTTVTDGRGRLIVTATGMRTEVGKIGALIDEAGDRDTPLERKLAQLGQALVGVVLALCAVIVLAGWLRGHAFLHMLEVGISLAIAAVPEGLPAVATMTLAHGHAAHGPACARWSAGSPPSRRSARPRSSAPTRPAP